MVIIDKLKAFVQELDDKTFYTYLTAFLAGIVFVLGIVMFMSFNKITKLRSRVKQVNYNRQTIQELLTKFEKVKQQKAEVAAILEKDKNFKIVGYLDSLLAKLGLTQNKTNYTQSSENKESLPEYIEIKLVVQLTDLNMRQLVDLLHEIEKTERIYTKELEITRSATKPSIDVTLTIATLQPRAEGTEE